MLQAVVAAGTRMSLSCASDASYLRYQNSTHYSIRCCHSLRHSRLMPGFHPTQHTQRKGLVHTVQFTQVTQEPKRTSRKCLHVGPKLGIFLRCYVLVGCKSRLTSLLATVINGQSQSHLVGNMNIRYNCSNKHVVISD